MRALIVLLSLTLVPVAPPESAPTSEAVELEEYEVFSALISQMYVEEGVELIVVQGHTETGLNHGGPLIDPRQLRSPARGKVPLEALQPETFEDFLARNQQSHPLEPRFNLKVKYVPVSKKELEDLFRDRSGWDRFYAQYPHSQGVVRLSRVGFNGEKDQALVYVGNQKHWLAGKGYCVLLAKKDGAWTVQDKVMLWIS